MEKTKDKQYDFKNDDINRFLNYFNNEIKISNAFYNLLDKDCKKIGINNFMLPCIGKNAVNNIMIVAESKYIYFEKQETDEYDKGLKFYKYILEMFLKGESSIKIEDLKKIIEKKSYQIYLREPFISYLKTRGENLKECEYKKERILDYKGWPFKKIIQLIVGESNPNKEIEALQSISYFNFFSLPFPVMIGESRHFTEAVFDKICKENDSGFKWSDYCRKSSELLDEYIKEINPSKIVFCSKSGYVSYCGEYKNRCDYTVHPCCAWWNRDNGKYGYQKFIKIVKGIKK